MMYKVSSHKGFTLIELLVVIALLGIIALGLLAAIDPVEQIRKGRDTALRNVASQYYNAELRYYATKGSFTWGTSAFTASGGSSMTSNIGTLIGAGELKSNFIGQAGANIGKLFITSTSAQDVAVCFQPESKGFQADAVTIYGSDANESTSTCKSSGSSGGVNCYMCLR
jgi:prepilin-type N-terminal cleavage/methylation domain-containing protein